VDFPQFIGCCCRRINVLREALVIASPAVNALVDRVGGVS
jgi:hypothetical protein